MNKKALMYIKNYAITQNFYDKERSQFTVKNNLKLKHTKFKLSYFPAIFSDTYDLEFDFLRLP